MFQEAWQGILWVGIILAANALTLLPSFRAKGKAGRFLNSWGWAFLLLGKKRIAI